MSARAIGVVCREVATAESGLTFLQVLIDCRHPAPPFADSMGCWLVEATEGRALFEGEPRAAFLNPLGGIHGGWTSGILDSAMACAVHSTLGAGQAYTTLELKIHLVRSITPDSGRLTCEGRLVHRGGTIATSEGYLRDAAGRLLAHGTETCLILDAARAARG